MKNNHFYQRFLILFLFISSFILPLSAHAYAGPGVAIGAIIVFLTIILSFFASTLITILKFISKFIKWVINSLKKIFLKSNKKVKKNKQ